jgi:hypothetical protein
MKILKATVPYVVFLGVCFGLVYVYAAFFSPPAKPVKIGANHFYGLGHEVALSCLVYSTAVLLARVTGQLKPGVLFGLMTAIYVVPLIYVEWIIDRMNVTEDVEAIASMYSPSSQEMWLLRGFGILISIVLPVLILVLINHLTRRSSRTRKRAA